MSSVASPNHTPRCHCQACSSTSTFKLVFSPADFNGPRLLACYENFPTVCYQDFPYFFSSRGSHSCTTATTACFNRHDFFNIVSKSVPATSAAHTPKLANGHTVISGSLTHRQWSRIFDITGKRLKGFGLVKEANVRRVRRGRDCKRSGAMQMRYHCLRHGLRPRPRPKLLLSPPGLQGR